MTIVDGDSNGIPDGIINLYDEYNAITGNSISTATGTWFDPNFNFALDESSGDLYLWDLDESSEAGNDYQFQLIDAASGCPDDILVRLNVVVGPFSGIAVPPVGLTEVNVQICDIGQDPCGSSTNFDLYTVFLSEPTAHLNGTWRYEGSSSNFIGIDNNRYLLIDIPYQPGPPLVDDEIFELIYEVPGIAPCQTSVETRVKISAVREVFAGAANIFNICDTEMMAGNFGIMDLRGDDYLVNEDIEGIWLYEDDTTGQLTGPGDSVINLQEVYNNLYATNQRFGCESFEYSYFVESRSAVCESKTSSVIFNIFESLRPFQQSGPPPEFCVGGVLPSNFNLFNELSFTTENGVLYRYPPKLNMFGQQTTFTQISGSKVLPLDDYSGVLDLSGLTNADAGTYQFRYNVFAGYHCSELSPGFLPETIFSKPDGCTSSLDDAHPCQPRSAVITLIVRPNLYAGEDTVGLAFCEDDPNIASPLDLFTLLGTNGVETVYQGSMGVWTETLSGNVIANPYAIPQIMDQQRFDFTYTTTSSDGCIDQANLVFDVFELYSPGMGGTLDICDNNNAFNLFDQLTGNPNTTGTWSGPNGFSSMDHNANFDPSSNSAGTYVYTVPDNPNDPDNELCSGSQATLIINVAQSPKAGSNMVAYVCRSDNQIDLVDYLDSNADSGGIFTDLEATGTLSGSQLDVAQLDAGAYDFQYELQGAASCNLSAAVITINVEDLPPPESSDQIFCASDGPTIVDLQYLNASEVNWYDSIESDVILSTGTALINGAEYYAAAVDMNGCESTRIAIAITLLPIDHVDCDDCIKDGISVNGDGENDRFELCNLPIAFPDFEIQIFNRYGVIVYKGDRGTPLFDGVSNASMTIGKELPSGVYFYVFNPNDGVTDAFQGNFYLSR